jgi:hypothetical protein
MIIKNDLTHDVTWVKKTSFNLIECDTNKIELYHYSFLKNISLGYREGDAV